MAINDEEKEQERFVRFVGGTRRADGLQQLWNSSYPFMGKSKLEMFKSAAKSCGYSCVEIRMFLNLGK